MNRNNRINSTCNRLIVFGVLLIIAGIVPKCKGSDLGFLYEKKGIVAEGSTTEEIEITIPGVQTKLVAVRATDQDYVDFANEVIRIVNAMAREKKRIKPK